MKFGYVSGLPETELVSRFMRELVKNKLMGTKCSACSKKYLPPRAHCTCGSSNMEWYEAPHRGQILTYTLINFPPESMSKHVPYIIAVAELEDGSRILARLTDFTSKTLEVGLRVDVVCQRLPSDRAIYVLKPLSS